MITKENGHKVAKLICVSSENNNKYYNMTQINDNEFEAEWGRVEGSRTIRNYPMDDWDAIYRDKTRESKKPKPYSDVTHLVAEKTVGDVKTPSKNGLFNSSRSSGIKDFIESIMKYAKQSVEENYVISSNKVTQKQVDEAQNILNSISLDLKVGSDISNLNDTLLELYKVIPRKMKKVQDHLLEGSGKLKDADFDIAKKIFSEEQDNLDVMAGQVSMLVTENQASDEKKQEHDILHTLNLDLYEPSPAEIKMIKDKLGKNKDQFVRAFRAHNKASDESFKKFVTKVNEKKCDILWHGSRNENWWSIFQQSLKIRPTNAVTTGSMFGYGVYFADKAHKSIGYTSSHNSRWARGNSSRAILGLYEIHQGKQMVIEKWKNEHSSLDESKMKKKGYHSVFAKGGYDLVNNEFIIYNDSQCTIRYFIEIKS